MFSLDQIAFVVLFAVFFSLLILCGELPIGILVMGLIVLLFFFFRSKLDFKKDNQSFSVFLTFLALLTISGISLLFTQSIPLTLNKFIFYLFSYICFSFFYFLNKKWMPTAVILSGLSLVGVQVFILSQILTFFPTFSQHLNSLNLLVSNYGHNHSGIYFVFLFPISFYMFLKEKKKKLSILLLCLTLLGVILSFGRGYLLEVVCEFALLYSLFSVDLSKSYRRFLVLAGVFFIVIFLLLNLGKNFGPICAQADFKDRICKTYTEQVRFSYWQQAVDGFLMKPFTGWGGGTFNLISLRFQQGRYLYTSYAHNEYLQVFAEYGVFGGSIFCVLILLILIKLIAKLFTEKMRSNIILEMALSISVISLCFNAFIDYDWSYISIWSLFVIATALVLRGIDQSNLPLKWGGIEQFRKKLAVFSYLFASIIIVTWTVLYVLGQMLWAQKNLNQSLRIFPFVYWEVEEVIGSTKIDPQTTQFLLKLYENDPSTTLSYISQVKSIEQSKRNYESLIKLYPKDFSFRLQYLNFLTAHNDYLAILNLLKMSSYSEMNGKYRISDEASAQKMASTGVMLANTLLKDDQEMAVQMYVAAVQVDKDSVYSDDFEVLLNPNAFPPNVVQSTLNSFPDHALLFKYRDLLASWYMAKITSEANAQQWSLVNLDVAKLLQLGSWNRGLIWDTLPKIYNNMFFGAFENQEYTEARDTLIAWQETQKMVKAADLKPLDPYWSQVLESYLTLLNSH